MRNFRLQISYSTLAVFDAALDQPFNNWSERHTSQGFSWRQRSVSFRMLKESGVAQVEVEIVDSPSPLRPESTRAIQVPYDVSTNGEVEVASIGDGVRISVPPGTYNVLYEVGLDAAGAQTCRLQFVRSDSPDARLVKIDDELNPAYPLLMIASAATP